MYHLKNTSPPNISKEKKWLVYTVSTINIVHHILPCEYICEFAIESLDAYQRENYFLKLIDFSESVAYST